MPSRPDAYKAQIGLYPGVNRVLRKQQDDTLEPLADGIAGDVDEVTLFENILDDEPLAGLEAVNGLESKLLEVAHGDGAGLLQVAQLGLGELAVTDAAVAHLDSVVAIGSGGLDLGDDIALSEADDGDGDDGAVGLEVGHHAELGPHHADSRLHAHDRHPPPAMPAGEEVPGRGERAERTQRGGAQGEESGAGKKGDRGFPGGRGREGRAASASHQRHLHSSTTALGAVPLCLVHQEVSAKGRRWNGYGDVNLNPTRDTSSKPHQIEP